MGREFSERGLFEVGFWARAGGRSVVPTELLGVARDWKEGGFFRLQQHLPR
jgi:hypothetical protein